MMLRASAATALALVCASPAYAQSPPCYYPPGSSSCRALQNHDIPGTSAWNGFFAAKQDTLTLGTGVSAALGNSVDASGGLLTFGKIGTSGTSIPLLSEANTWSATQTMQAIIPATDNAYSLGTAGSRYSKLYSVGAQIGDPTGWAPIYYTYSPLTAFATSTRHWSAFMSGTKTSLTSLTSDNLIADTCVNIADNTSHPINSWCRYSQTNIPATGVYGQTEGEENSVENLGPPCQRVDAYSSTSNGCWNLKLDSGIGNPSNDISAFNVLTNNGGKSLAGIVVQAGAINTGAAGSNYGPALSMPWGIGIEWDAGPGAIFTGGTGGASSTTVTVSGVSGTVNIYYVLNGYGSIVTACSPSCASPTSLTVSPAVTIADGTALSVTNRAWRIFSNSTSPSSGQIIFGSNTEDHYIGPGGFHALGFTTSSVQLGGVVIPFADNTSDVGSSAKRWATGYFTALAIGHSGAPTVAFEDFGSATILGQDNVAARFGAIKNSTGVDAATLVGVLNGNMPFIGAANGETTTATAFAFTFNGTSIYNYNATTVYPQTDNAVAFGDAAHRWSNGVFAGFSTGAMTIGEADAATPIAHTVRAQSVLAGTTDAAGAATYIVGSKSTGAGVGGPIVFQVTPASTTGSTQNATVNALTINGNGTFSTVSAGAYVIGSGAASSTYLSLTGRAFVGTDLTNTLIESFTNKTIKLQTNCSSFGVGCTDAITITAAGLVSIPSIPASAGAGGLYVCVDTAGAIYKKASCP